MKAPLEGRELHWRPGGVLVNFGKGFWGQDPGWDAWDARQAVQPVVRKERIHRANISPDGKMAAYIDNRQAMQGGADFNKPFPQARVLVNLDSGAERVVENFVYGWYFGTEGDFTQWVAWSPDGSQIAALDPVQRGAGGRTDLVLYDIKAGTRTVARKRLPEEVSAWGTRLSWSKDGKSLRAGRRIIPLRGGPVTTLPSSGWYPGWWDDAEQRLLGSTGEWDTVFVYDVRTDARLELGPGMPVGWIGDWVYVIRWAGSDQRHRCCMM